MWYNHGTVVYFGHVMCTTHAVPFVIGYYMWVESKWARVVSQQSGAMLIILTDLL